MFSSTIIVISYIKPQYSSLQVGGHLAHMVGHQGKQYCGTI